ncbi:ABC transporter ATP-binding protein [Aureimonas sp. AU40]|uniref:ABC transporter ATP-binding protein n=1 Tax=Aureimonas sp. AU40 TaxID=1637747 RepID=UPI0009EADA0E|nr:ABC transporter ATP-binding protein [Aureimonas sp. AU40]
MARAGGILAGLGAGDRAGGETGADLAPDIVLSVRDLQTHFVSRRQTAKSVDGVTFDLRRGETVAVVGESGSGKSVTSLSIMRLLADPGRIVAGEILYRDRGGRVRDLARAGLREMRALRGTEIAMIFQEPMTSLNPLFTVGDQIAEMIMLHERIDRRAALDRAGEMLELVEIPAARRRVNDYPHHMSGGMRQRVMIALALANKPSLLIADEPTTALDVTIQAQILDLLRRLQREMGMSILFITHNLGVVAEIAREVVVMYAGRVVEQAPVRDLFARPRHPYTEGLLACTPNAARDIGPDGQRRPLLPIPGSVPPITALPPGCTYAPRCAYAVPGCTLSVPPLFTVAPGHLSRCLRTDLL